MLGELFLRDGPADASRQARTVAENVRLRREPRSSLANKMMQRAFAPFGSEARIDGIWHYRSVRVACG